MSKSAIADQFVKAGDYAALLTENVKLKGENAKLNRRLHIIHDESYAQGQEYERREYLNARVITKVSESVLLAHLTLPDNGGAIQFHPVQRGRRPITGGLLSPDPQFLLRIWGPPSDSYGVHEQGGGNLTDFSMTFDLTREGMIVHRMDHVGVRSKWR
jgi:hypothetical protein